MRSIMEMMGQAKTAAISGHVRPDGDCLGSCLALYRYLKQNTEAEVTLYLEAPEGKLAELPGAEEIVSALPDPVPQAELFFVLDCGDAGRLGFSEPAFRKAVRTVCIDHHISNNEFADDNYVVPDSSSTCELLFGLMEEDKIDSETAECLYTGILHDTGVFHHSCTGRKTMEIAGRLMEKGIDFPKLIDEGFYRKTYIQNQVLGRCLMESMLLWGGLGIVSYLTHSAMEFYGAKPSDMGGIIDQLRLTEGVEAAIFLYETETPQEFKVSMRSNGDVDVCRIAMYFGGGGHVKAAGATMTGTVHDVINNLTGQLEVQLKQLGKVCADT